MLPQFTLERQHAALAPQLDAAARRVLASGRFVQGIEVAALEAELGAALAAPHVVACANGTDALHLALRAAGVGPGDVVLTTPFTFFATVGAILLTGARAEFADIDPTSFLLAPAAVAAALRRPRRQRLAAILPVHLYGRLADMAALARLAAAAGVPLVEDACQAIGAGPLAGRCAALSFYPTKNLGALGEAGCVLTADASLAATLRELRSHGSPRRYQHDRLGWNARMDELQAAFLRVKLPHLSAWNARRRALAAAYEDALLATGRAALAGTPAAERAPLVLPQRTPDHVFHQYTVRVTGGRRDQVRAALAKAGIGAEIYYPLAAHRQPVLAGNDDPPLPHAECAAAEVLSLPMFPELTETEVAQVVAVLARAVLPASRPA